MPVGIEHGRKAEAKIVFVETTRATLAFKLKVTTSGCNLADSPNAIIASEAALPIQPLPSSERPYGGHPRKGLPRS